MLKLLLLVAVVALAVYLTVRLMERQGQVDRPPPPRPMGPDDDPDFLRDLDRRQRPHSEGDETA